MRIVITPVKDVLKILSMPGCLRSLKTRVSDRMRMQLELRLVKQHVYKEEGYTSTRWWTILQEFMISPVCMSWRMEVGY